VENQSDRNAEETPSEEPIASHRASGEVEEVGTRNSGFRAGWRSLGSWTFWLRLGVGALILGTGVLIGLGIAWFIDDSRGSDDDEGRRGGSFASRVDPSGGWSGEEGFWSQGERFDFPPKGFKLVPDGQIFPDPGDWRRRDHRMDEWLERRGEWFQKEGSGAEGYFRKDETYLPKEAVEILEGLVEQVEELVERVEEYMEEGRFGPFRDWPEESSERGGGLRDEDAEGPLAGFDFPFGEILPGLAFLEECELDFQSLPAIIEEFEDVDGEEAREDENQDGEDIEGFFQQIEELFDDLCETPADN